MDVVEPARLFESMVVGRRFDEAPLITSRICGICSPNHAITSIKALEAALGVEVSERTKLLRKLLVYGRYLQNHATHLYLFAAPDYVGLPSVFPLAETHPDVVERALRIKKLGNELTHWLGGRSVHPVTAVIGGFTAEPSRGELEAFARPAARGCRRRGRHGRALRVVRRARLRDRRRDARAVGAEATTRSTTATSARSTRAGAGRSPSTATFVTETVVGHSNAKHSTVDGRTFMVGALPRVNLNVGPLAAGRADRGDARPGCVPCRATPFAQQPVPGGRARGRRRAVRRCCASGCSQMAGSQRPGRLRDRGGRGHRRDRGAARDALPQLERRRRRLRDARATSSRRPRRTSRTSRRTCVRSRRPCRTCRESEFVLAHRAARAGVRPVPVLRGALATCTRHVHRGPARRLWPGRAGYQRGQES